MNIFKRIFMWNFDRTEEVCTEQIKLDEVTIHPVNQVEFDLPKTYGKIEVYQDKNKQYRFRVKSNNGNIIVSSEAYKGKQGVMNGVAAMKRIAEEGELIEL